MDGQCKVAYASDVVEGPTRPAMVKRDGGVGLRSALRQSFPLPGSGSFSDLIAALDLDPRANRRSPLLFSVSSADLLTLLIAPFPFTRDARRGRSG